MLFAIGSFLFRAFSASKEIVDPNPGALPQGFYISRRWRLDKESSQAR
jgi:hypothetical protein